MAKRTQALQNENLKSLLRQAVLILAIATFAWCAGTGMNLGVAVFRSLVVYLGASILTYALNVIIVRMRIQAMIEEQEALAVAAEEEKNALNVEAEVETEPGRGA